MKEKKVKFSIFFCNVAIGIEHLDSTAPADCTKHSASVDARVCCVSAWTASATSWTATWVAATAYLTTAAAATWTAAYVCSAATAAAAGTAAFRRGAAPPWRRVGR